MKKKNPTAKFYDCPFIDKAGCSMCNNCPYMGLNDLEKVYQAMKSSSEGLLNKVGGELVLSEDLRIKAEKPLRKMLEMS